MEDLKKYYSENPDTFDCISYPEFIELEKQYGEMNLKIAVNVLGVDASVLSIIEHVEMVASWP